MNWQLCQGKIKKMNNTINTTGSASSINFPSRTVVGICSICGGNVSQPMYWNGLFVPEPTCDSCGAVKSPLPVIQMVHAPKKIEYTDGTGSSHPDCVEITTTDGKNLKVW